MLMSMTQLTHFQIIPDFNAQSARPVCYLSHLPKQNRRRPQQQDHEVDEFILRGPEIDFEGYMDIRPAVIIDTAREAFGMVSAAEAETLQAALQLQQELSERLQAELDTANERLKGMILANAEQIVQISGMEAELTQAYEDLYADHEVDDDDDAEVDA